MRTFKLIAGLSFLLLMVACQDKKRSSQIEVAENESKYVVLAYVTSWGESTPDPACLTHINYAFGHVTDNFKGIRIDNEPRLQMVVGLREKKPSLKVLLSVGGWGSSRFSEMAQTDSTRMAFAADCKRVIDQFDLDGIDIDWEYPGIGTAGVSFSPEDTDNFSLLMKDIRHAIGKDKLLTIATQAGAKYYNLRAVEPYVDYVNIMTYDMEESPNHHSALYRSEMAEEWSCEDAVAAHVAAGFPVGRLVLGIPFYGHGTNEAPELLDYRHIIALDSLQSCWDSAAQVPYMVNSQGHVVVNYENAQSIAFKCQFLHQKGMLGAMYWDYDSDDEKGTLRHAVYQGVMNPYSFSLFFLYLHIFCKEDKPLAVFCFLIKADSRDKPIKKLLLLCRPLRYRDSLIKPRPNCGGKRYLRYVEPLLVLLMPDGYISPHNPFL